jgi:aspartyl protease family protein
VGDIELRNVDGAVHDGDFPRATLLGMSFLGRLNMRQDGQVLELEKKY